MVMTKMVMHMSAAEAKRAKRRKRQLAGRGCSTQYRSIATMESEKVKKDVDRYIKTSVETLPSVYQSAASAAPPMRECRFAW